MGRLAIRLGLCAALAACGDAPDPGAPAADRPADSRPLISEVRSAALETTPTNTILTATGLAPVQGYWHGELVPVETGDPALLAFGFRAAAPTGPVRASTPRSREVTVALSLTPEEIAGVRLIRITGAGNDLSVRP